MTELTDLIARIEAASADEQGAELVNAWSALNSTPNGWHGNNHGIGATPDEFMVWAHSRNAFLSMTDVYAFESAALTLVPSNMRDEMQITTIYCVARVEINMNHGDDASPFYGENACNVMSMAIAAAALKARTA